MPSGASLGWRGLCTLPPRVPYHLVRITHLDLDLDLDLDLLLDLHLHLNLSETIWIHPNKSECIWINPNKLKNAAKRPAVNICILHWIQNSLHWLFQCSGWMHRFNQLHRFNAGFKVRMTDSLPLYCRRQSRPAWDLFMILETICSQVLVQWMVMSFCQVRNWFYSPFSANYLYFATKTRCITFLKKLQVHVPHWVVK